MVMVVSVMPGPFLKPAQLPIVRPAAADPAPAVLPLAVPLLPAVPAVPPVPVLPAVPVPVPVPAPAAVDPVTELPDPVPDPLLPAVPLRARSAALTKDGLSADPPQAVVTTMKEASRRVHRRR